MKNVFKWRIVTNKYLYITDENNGDPFILEKTTGNRIYPSGIVTGTTIDEGKIGQIVSNIKNENTYKNLFDAMVSLASIDEDASKLTFLDYTNYWNLDSEECVIEAVTPKCEGYEPVFNVSAHTINGTEVEYTFFAERNEYDKTLRYNLDLGIPRGEKGEPGESGVGCKGDNGEDGKDAVISHVDATAHTVSGSTPTASVVTEVDESTNSYTMTFDFGIPKGEIGEGGGPGEKGEDGYPGVIANVVPYTNTVRYDDPANVTISNIQIVKNEADMRYETSFDILFDIPQGETGAIGPEGLPAIFRQCSARVVETLEWFKTPEVNAILTPLGYDNKYDLDFEFKLPQGKPGSSYEPISGGTGGGGWTYNFYDVEFVETSDETPSGNFNVYYHPTLNEADVYLQIRYPENWVGGGDECDDDCRKHRYEYYQNNSDSLSEGMKETINGVTYPLAAAQGVRSHAEGIGMESSMPSLETVTCGIKNDCYDDNILVFPKEQFTNAGIDWSELDSSFFSGATFSIPSGLPIDDYRLPGDVTVSQIRNATLTITSCSLYNDDNENDYFTVDDVYVSFEAGGQTYENYNIMRLTTEKNVNWNYELTIHLNNSMPTGTPNAVGIATHTEGRSCQAIESYSHAEGWNTVASGISSHAEGYGTVAEGDYSHAGGYSSIPEHIKASGDGSFAQGYAVSGATIENESGGSGCFAQGYASHRDSRIYTNTDGAFAHGFVAEGGEIRGEDNGAFVGGRAVGKDRYGNSANIESDGPGSIVHGYVYNTDEDEETSYIWGGDGSVATGYAEYGGHINASGGGSFAQGYAVSGGTIISSGYGSHAEGYAYGSGGTIIASGIGSHAEGVGTIANQDCMTAIGKFNNSGTTSGDLFAIGNGTDNEHRSNVLSVNGSTNKITLANNGGIQLPSGGSSTLVWNTSGGTTDISSLGGGTVTSITAGTGLSGGTITSSGTISLNVSGGTNISLSEDSVGKVTIDADIPKTQHELIYFDPDRIDNGYEGLITSQLMYEDGIVVDNAADFTNSTGDTSWAQIDFTMSSVATNYRTELVSCNPYKESTGGTGSGNTLDNSSLEEGSIMDTSNEYWGYDTQEDYITAKFNDDSGSRRAFIYNPSALDKYFVHDGLYGYSGVDEGNDGIGLAFYSFGKDVYTDGSTETYGTETVDETRYTKTTILELDLGIRPSKSNGRILQMSIEQFKRKPNDEIEELSDAYWRNGASDVITGFLPQPYAAFQPKRTFNNDFSIIGAGDSLISQNVMLQSGNYDGAAGTVGFVRCTTERSGNIYKFRFSQPNTFTWTSNYKHTIGQQVVASEVIIDMDEYKIHYKPSGITTYTTIDITNPERRKLFDEFKNNNTYFGFWQQSTPKGAIYNISYAKGVGSSLSNVVLNTHDNTVYQYTYDGWKQLTGFKPLGLFSGSHLCYNKITQKLWYSNGSEIYEIKSDGGGGGTGSVTNVGTGACLTGGPITSSGTISHDISGANAGTYGPTADVTGTDSATLSVPKIIVDAYGHITSIENKTYTSKDTDTWRPVSANTSAVTSGDSLVLSGGTNVTLSTGRTGTVTTVTFNASDTNTDYQVQQSHVNTALFRGVLLTNATGSTINTIPTGTTTAQTWFSTTLCMKPSTGDLYSEGAYYAASDARKKEVVKQIPLDKAYELVEKCQTIFYTWKNDEENKQQIGLLAQEVQEYFPELVSEGSDGYLSLDYSKLTVILLAVIRDLTTRVKHLETLEERIKSLEEKLN